MRKWRETANEHLEKVKSSIDELPIEDEVFVRPSSAYQMPDLSNADEVALHIAKLVSENHALKRGETMPQTAAASGVTTSPLIKRSQSFQPSKVDE